MVHRLTQGALRALRMLRLCSGKSSSCSRPETKAESAGMRLESDFRGSNALFEDLKEHTVLCTHSGALVEGSSCIYV
jgi:hypothetical protein